MTDDRAWDRVEEYVQLIGRMEETLREVDRFLIDTLGYPEDHQVRLSIAKRLAEAEELASE
jgi:DNA-binding transcriptional regulator/RsmH inhibitor MraZ